MFNKLSFCQKVVVEQTNSANKNLEFDLANRIRSRNEPRQDAEIFLFAFGDCYILQ